MIEFMMIFSIFIFIRMKVSNFIKQNEIEININAPVRNGYFRLKLDIAD